MDVTESQLATALEGFYVRVGPTAGGMGTSSAQLADADGAACTLFATLKRMAALREPDDDVVDADICCDHEHLPDDRELALMAAILRGMDQLDRDARQRIRNWVDERFVPKAVHRA